MIEPVYEEIPAELIRQQTEHEKWLAAQIKRIDPHEGEQGNEAGYTLALEKLVRELRTENMRLLTAMQRLADWGGLPGGDHYSGTISGDVMQWFRDGMAGPIPLLPDWATGDRI